MVEQYDITLTKGIRGATKRKKKTSPRPQGFVWYYLGIAGQIGYTIAVPIAGGVIVGSWIDSKRASAPVGTLVGLGIGVGVAVIGFVKVLQESVNKKP